MSFCLNQDREGEQAWDSKHGGAHKGEGESEGEESDADADSSDKGVRDRLRRAREEQVISREKRFVLFKIAHGRFLDLLDYASRTYVPAIVRQTVTQHVIPGISYAFPISMRTVKALAGTACVTLALQLYLSPGTRAWVLHWSRRAVDASFYVGATLALGSLIATRGYRGSPQRKFKFIAASALLGGWLGWLALARAWDRRQNPLLAAQVVQATITGSQ